MTALNLTELTAHIYDVLRLDSNVAALNLPIYSYVPQDSALPYISIDLGRARPLHASGLEAVEVECDINLYSQALSVAALLDAQKAIDAALHDHRASLASVELSSMRMLRSDQERLRDGQVMRATVTFRAVLTT